MGEVKHTPGPWSAWIKGDTIQVDNRGGDGRRPNIVDWSGFDQNDLPLSENKANARLIAAAPDMLEALKSTARGLECEFGPRAAEVNFPALYAAIAKAEGRS